MVPAPASGIPIFDPRISPRRLLAALYEAAVAGAQPDAATRTAVAALGLQPGSTVHLIAVGKAALAMTAAAVAALADAGLATAGGVVVAPNPPPATFPDLPATLRMVTGDHPIPGQGSLRAAEMIGEATSAVRRDEDVVVLVSGGGSSLAAAPASEISDWSQNDVAALYEALLASGADIRVVNAVRKRFARWAGGRLAAALAHARVHCLVVSDVPGDDAGSVSSGPCAPDPMDAATLNTVLQSQGVWDRLPSAARAHLVAVARGQAQETPKPGAAVFQRVETRIIVSNRQALTAAADRARAAGLEEVTIETALLDGEAAICGVRLASDLIARRKRARGARIPRCILWGGETTVTFNAVRRSPIVSLGSTPLGGRSQELALAAARSLADAGDQAAGITVLAAGTDGRDGPTDAAGAIVDGSTWPAIAAAGRDPSDDLARHDSYHALDSVGALMRPGLTGTNVMDVVIGLIL